MITNIGKGIIGKYLLGQAPAYASYIAVGCGPEPLTTAQAYGDYSQKENLDFEMFRVPISSKGFVNDNGTEKIVLTAELPTEERYEITEVGIYSAGNNPSAGAYDSKTVFAFSQAENWQHHTSTAATAIPTYLGPLDAPTGNGNINTTTYPEAVFQANSDNLIFFNTNRASRYERCRFLNNMILMKGDDADLTLSGGHFVINSGSNHIHLTSPNVDFSKNSPLDELRLAFSIVSKDGATSEGPDIVRILVEFSSTDAVSTGEFARFEAELLNQGSTGSPDYNFSTNRYYVVTKQLQELYTTQGFTWDAVTVVKIYASTIDGGVPTSNYYIALDALRLENIATTNPLYGLTGYSVIKNTDGVTIIKSPNTSNFIEFRFSIGVT